MANKNDEEKTPVDSADFVEITLSPSFSEINTFWGFMQKFKMATKSGGKTISEINRFFAFYAEIQDSRHGQGDTRQVKNFVKITLFPSALHFMQKF